MMYTITRKYGPTYISQSRKKKIHRPTIIVNKPVKPKAHDQQQQTRPKDTDVDKHDPRRKNQTQ